MNRRIMPIFVVFGLVVMIVIGILGAVFIKFKSPGKDKMDLSEYYGLQNNEEAALILNDQIMEIPGKIWDDAVYIDYKTVTSYVNSAFYWDEKKQQLIITVPDQIKYLKVDDTGYTTKNGAPAFRMDQESQTYYLAVDLIKEYTDMDCEFYEDPARVVMRTRWNGLETAEITDDTKVRYKGGIKSEILTEVSQGDTVYVLEQMENWSKVATMDGFIGYVENKKMGELQEAPVRAVNTKFEFEHTLLEQKINLAFHQVTSQAGNNKLAEVIANTKGINVIAPTWFYVKSNDGTVNTLADPQYVKTAHDAGMYVWGLFSNLEAEIDTMQVLADSEKRAYMISQILAEAERTQLDGINLDFENITEEMSTHYIQFIREFTMAAHEKGLVVSVDNPVPQSYNQHYNRDEQAKIVDYMVIMGYDEHYSGSEEAGSVASLPFVESGIRDTLKSVPANRVINAIPFYTRIWIQENGGTLRSEVLGMNGADEYVEGSHMDKQWDEKSGQYVASVQNKNGTYTIWMEEERSIEEKMKLIQKYDLAGVAEWKLGFERPSVWDVINKYLQ